MDDVLIGMIFKIIGVMVTQQWQLPESSCVPERSGTPDVAC